MNTINGISRLSEGEEKTNVEASPEVTAPTWL